MGYPWIRGPDATERGPYSEADAVLTSSSLISDAYSISMRLNSLGTISESAGHTAREKPADKQRDTADATTYERSRVGDRPGASRLLPLPLVWRLCGVMG